MSKAVRIPRLDSRAMSRFAGMFLADDVDKCWQWVGRMNKAYGRFYYLRREAAAHRVAYQEFRGPLDPELTVHHLCHKADCVNPWHLEQIPLRENAAMNAWSMRDACSRGHDYTPENTRWTTQRRESGVSTFRNCRTCVRENMRKSRAGRKLTMATDGQGVKQ